MRRSIIFVSLALLLVGAGIGIAGDGEQAAVTVTDRTQTSIKAEATGLEPGTPYRVCFEATCVDSSTLDPDPTPTLTPTPTATPTPEPVACPSWRYDLDTYGGGVIPGACWRPFADDSPWNTPVPASPRLASNSAQIVARTFAMDGNAATKYPQNMDLDPAMTRNEPNGTDWGHPAAFFSQPTDPLYKFHCVKYGCPDLEGRSVRVPAAARAADGGDGHMGIIDRASGLVWDLYEAYGKPAAGGTWDIGSGGVSQIGGSGQNVDIDAAGNVVGLVGQSEATAARYSVLAGMIRPPHIQAGRIPHALFLVVKCDRGGFVWPAQKSGTRCADTVNAPPMGARYWFDMTAAEIDALTVKPTLKTILRAWHEFGAFMGDTGGGGYGLMFESPETYHSWGQQSPLVSVAQAEAWAPYNGQYILKPSEVPAAVWDRLRVLDPCVTDPTC